MMRMVSDMIVNEWKKCCGMGGFITNIQGIGLGIDRKDLYFNSEGAFRHKRIDRNKRMNAPTCPELADCRRNSPDDTVWRCLWLDDVRLPGWKQMYGKWYCAYDVEKDKDSKVSGVINETDSAKSSGDQSEQAEINGLNEADTKKEAGNKDEIFMPFSHKYDKDCFRLVQKKYITRI